MKRILIKNSTMVGFADECLLDMESGEITRVSEIMPSEAMLRACFRLCRRLGNDKSVLANWTRTWRCEWRLTVFDSGETKLFADRGEAILYEKDVIRRSKLMERALSADKLRKRSLDSQRREKSEPPT